MKIYKNITKKLLIALPILCIAWSCQLFDAPDDTENVQERLINFPAIFLKGEPVVVFDAEKPNEAYRDAGIEGFFKGEDISAEIEISGLEEVDTNTPGVYNINYQVTKTNSIGSEVSASASRRVFVVCPNEDNLSGDYVAVSREWSAGTSPETKNSVTIRQVSPGLYALPDFIFGRFNGISTNDSDVYEVCGELQFPTQNNLAGLALAWSGQMEVLETAPDGKILSFTFSFGVISTATRAVITYTRQ